MKVVLLILILSGGYVYGTSARGDQNQGMMLDEDVKEMTLEDIMSINNSTDTDTKTSNFDIVDEKSIDEELKADDLDKDPVKTSWLIVVFCCFGAFIVILLTVVVTFLCMKVKGDKMKKSQKKVPGKSEEKDLAV